MEVVREDLWRVGVTEEEEEDEDKVRWNKMICKSFF